MVSHELYLALWNAPNSIATTSFILQSRQTGTGFFQYHGHCIPNRGMVREAYLGFPHHLAVLALQIASLVLHTVELPMRRRVTRSMNSIKVALHKRPPHSGKRGIHTATRQQSMVIVHTSPTR